MNIKKIAVALSAPMLMNAQKVMTAETLWTLGRLGVEATAPDHSGLIYKVSKTDLKTEKNQSENYFLDATTKTVSKINFGDKKIIQWDKNGLYTEEKGIIYLSKDFGKTWTKFYEIGDVDNIVISPDGKKIAFSKEVLVENVLAKNKYQDTPNSSAHIYHDLNHRHWDYFNEGKYNHIFVVETSQNVSSAKDLLEGKLWDCPQRPFGGKEDIVWAPNSNDLLFVMKALDGIEYAKSTNTDIFLYNIQNKEIRNLTADNKGYDTNPQFSPDGKYLIWLSMANDGYESDKKEIKIMNNLYQETKNITKTFDETITGDIFWANDSKSIYFVTANRGTIQLFNLNPFKKNYPIRQITNGQFDIGHIYFQNKNNIIVSRTDINHSAELYSVNNDNGEMARITDINTDVYKSLIPSKSELKMVKTTDGKDMGVWFHYPPNFDPNKKYPALLYCQGGPQSPLSQFFSLRWNFALMTANDYIVIAPNRRGMPGWGVKWNEEISKDWGGQPMRDYLAATDFAKTLPYIDGDRVGVVGASYGGYSVLMLAGIHENRFKTFISHNGLFDMKSWSLTTEELWFANWDLGGNLFSNPLPKGFTEFNPSNYIQKWNKPMMIIQGGIDFRVPYEQGQGAFQAARLKGLKTKFLYFPDENHWVLKPHNALVWQREFFDWLKETL